MITVQDIQSSVRNTKLLDLCTNSSAEVESLISFVESKVWLYIDQEQFVDDSQYVYPDDLKKAVLHLIENQFVYEKIDFKTKSAEKIDDYSVNYKTPIMFFGIPVEIEYMDILQSYAKDNIGKSGYLSV